MKTQMTRFCETLLPTLGQLMPALATAAEALEHPGDPAPLLNGVNDVSARLLSLSDKLACPHAHLLIFGPLKSGKSTLMNAISGAYVSEVSSLPGYPSLVFVRHGSEPGISVTRYNGRESDFADARALKEVIADNHLALVEHIREAEARGEEFDPRRHFPEAVRRIDVRMPIANLEESGTVLVDTPGLYTRMKFSYDMLTREFRDSAACAIFVVKADNLFLEQVFEEFNQLLDLFSRIFLVVNVDSGKRDLQPDGTLAPSAESSDPQRIVEAFRALSMAGPLRAAHEQGRVRIHAVDLQQAAAAAITHSGDAGAGAFEAFQRDLTDYLNSSDYTREFVRDGLRQATGLCDEIGGICTGPEMAAVCARRDALAAEIAALDERLDACDRLLCVDWSVVFADARIANAQRAVAAAGERVGTLRRELEEALDRWYASGDSLKSLEQQYWSPPMRAVGDALTEGTVRALRKALANSAGGAVLPPDMITDLLTAGVDLAPVGQDALRALSLTDSTESFRIAVRAEAVPVKRSLGDWLLCRSRESVAQRLFGEDRAQAIAPDVKQQRLSRASHAALHGLIESALAEKFPDLPTKSAVHLLEHYVEKFCRGVIGGLNQGRESATRERAERQAPCERLGQMISAMQALSERGDTVRAGILRHAQEAGALPLVPDVPIAAALPISEPAAMEPASASPVA